MPAKVRRSVTSPESHRPKRPVWGPKTLSCKWSLPGLGEFLSLCGHELSFNHFIFFSMGLAVWSLLKAGDVHWLFPMWSGGLWPDQDLDKSEDRAIRKQRGRRSRLPSTPPSQPHSIHNITLLCLAPTGDLGEGAWNNSVWRQRTCLWPPIGFSCLPSWVSVLEVVLLHGSL